WGGGPPAGWWGGKWLRIRKFSREPPGPRQLPLHHASHGPPPRPLRGQGGLMARRSDHTRAELEALILDEGHRLMAETGYARFSAREVAKRVGYSIGTIYN